MKKEKLLRDVYSNPLYWFVKSDLGLSFIPIHKAILIILSGYGKYVSKKDIKFE